jgi:hypothetical protein
MMTIERERAERGRSKLNADGPADWAQRVDPETLDITDPFRCVLFQVFGNFVRGLEQLFPHRMTGVAVRHGFCPAREDESDNPDLILEWRRIIAEELAAARCA